MEISLNGYGEQVATFAVSGEVKVGMPVKISANGTVAPCGAKDKFCGVVLSLRGGYAAVQMAGYAELSLYRHKADGGIPDGQRGWNRQGTGRGHRTVAVDYGCG